MLALYKFIQENFFVLYLILLLFPFVDWLELFDFLILISICILYFFNMIISICISFSFISIQFIG